METNAIQFSDDFGDGEVTHVDAFESPTCEGDYVRTRTGNFFGLSDNAICMLAGMED